MINPDSQPFKTAADYGSLRGTLAWTFGESGKREPLGLKSPAAAKNALKNYGRFEIQAQAASRQSIM